MAEHTSPLLEEEVRHLLSRLSFGASVSEIQDNIGRTAGDLVDELLDAAASPLDPDPVWLSVQKPPRGAPDSEVSEFNSNNASWRDELRSTWVIDMSTDGLRGRLALFWHNHFVTGMEVYKYAAYGHNYLKTLKLNSQGNFKTFVHAIGRDPAMLIYLDGDTNTASAPNENYARELLELFTMSPSAPDGSANYTEHDIQEIARAMTGWRITPSSTWNSYLLFDRYDDGEKTIFGRTGAFNYNDVVEIIFEERSSQIAHFIADKLYREFVYQAFDLNSVSALAQTLLDSNFELRPVLRQLFTSERFLDSDFAGSRVKAPVEHLIGLFTELDLTPSPGQAEQLWRAAGETGQSLLSPPNVAGWPGHRYWLSTDTLPKRWDYSDFVLGSSIASVHLVTLGSSLVGPNSTHPALEVSVALARHAFKVPIEWVEIPHIEDDFAGDLDANPLPEWLVNGPEYQRDLAKLFLGSVPWYEFGFRSGSGPQMVTAFMVRLSQFPEFQLI